MAATGKIYRLRTFSDTNHPDYFNDDTIEWYRHTEAFPDMEIDDGVRIFGLPATVSRSLVMWKEFKNWKHVTVTGEVTIIDRTYQILPKPFGHNFPGRDHIEIALQFYENKGWNLLESAGPKIHPGVYEWIETGSRGQTVVKKYNASRHMKPLPPDWAECKKGVFNLQNPDLGKEDRDNYMKIIEMQAKMLGSGRNPYEAPVPAEAPAMPNPAKKSGEKVKVEVKE